MKKVYICRQPSEPEGTFGEMTCEVSQDIWATGELPWKDNESNLSCIPAGTYVCSIRKSDRMTELFGEDMYEILDVPNRYGCFIHPMNFCGDTTMGYKSDVEGCIGLGLSHGIIDAQKAVLSSRPAIKEFMALMGGEDFSLTIEGDV